MGGGWWVVSVVGPSWLPGSSLAFFSIASLTVGSKATTSKEEECFHAGPCQYTCKWNGVNWRI